MRKHRLVIFTVLLAFLSPELAWPDTTSLINKRIEAVIFSNTGSKISSTNPFPVTIINNPPGSTSFRQSTTTVDLAANTSVNHDYTNGGATSIRLKQIHVSSSGLIKANFLTGATCAGATDIGFVSFNQTGETILIKPLADLDIAAGSCLRVTILNREVNPQNVYSTVEGATLP